VHLDNPQAAHTACPHTLQLPLRSAAWQACATSFSPNFQSLLLYALFIPTLTHCCSSGIVSQTHRKAGRCFNMADSHERDTRMRTSEEAWEAPVSIVVFVLTLLMIAINLSDVVPALCCVWLCFFFFFFWLGFVAAFLFHFLLFF
jgi:hypothetical protein